MKKAFCWVYAVWMSRFIKDQNAPLVRVINLLWRGQCWYCTSVRMFIAGAGTGFALAGHYIIGAVLVAASIGLTVGERLWLCEVKETKVETKQG